MSVPWNWVYLNKIQLVTRSHEKIKPISSNQATWIWTCPDCAKYQLYCSSPGFWANRWYFRQFIETADSKVSLSWVKQCKNISQSMLSGHTARYSCAWAHLCSHLGPTLHGLRCGLQWWTDCRLAVFPPICPTSATWSPYWPLWKASVL